MLNVTLIAVGKLKERYLTDACAEYEKRLGAYCRLRVVEVDEYRLPQNPSEQQIQAGIEAEGKEDLAKIPAGSYLIPLCIEGKQTARRSFPRPWTVRQWTGRVPLCCSSAVLTDCGRNSRRRATCGCPCPG